MGWAIDGTIVGIRDMGTTHSCVGVWPHHHQNILTHHANTTTPSPSSLTPTNPNTTIAVCTTLMSEFSLCDEEGSDLLLAKVDGYWKIDEQGRTIAGIGGFIKETEGGKMCYIFSGPITCDSSRAAQVAAVSHIVGAIVDNDKIGREIQVHFDAMEVVKDIRNKSNGHLKLEKELEEIDDQIKQIPRLKLMHIPRESNEGADELAKLGSRRKNMVASWV